MNFRNFISLIDSITDRLTDQVCYREDADWSEEFAIKLAVIYNISRVNRMNVRKLQTDRQTK